MHEGQGHEFGEAAGTLLLRLDAQQMARPMYGLIDMPEHNGGGTFKADCMGDLHNLKPLGRVHLVGAEPRTNPIIENFRRRSGKTGEACVLQTQQIVAQGQTERFRTMPDFQRRKSMDMNLWRGRMHGLQNAQIGIARIARGDAALKADFSGAAVPSFAHALSNFLMGEVVGPVAIALRQTALGEGAKAAAIGADIGVVDVAVDHVSNCVADAARAQFIRRRDNLCIGACARGKQLRDGGLVACSEYRVKSAIRRDGGLDAGRLYADRGGQIIETSRRPPVFAGEARRVAQMQEARP